MSWHHYVEPPRCGEDGPPMSRRHLLCVTIGFAVIGVLAFMFASYCGGTP
jgi:hypothetical protein